MGSDGGQHWLDVVRFAETDGYEYDTQRVDAWRYRDYVIRAFNNDKPFDRFVTGATRRGDEIAPQEDETLIAAEDSTGSVMPGSERTLATRKWQAAAMRFSPR